MSLGYLVVAHPEKPLQLRRTLHVREEQRNRAVGSSGTAPIIVPGGSLFKELSELAQASMASR